MLTQVHLFLFLSALHPLRTLPPTHTQVYHVSVSRRLLVIQQREITRNLHPLLLTCWVNTEEMEGEIQVDSSKIAPGVFQEALRYWKGLGTGRHESWGQIRTVPLIRYLASPSSVGMWGSARHLWARAVLIICDIYSSCLFVLWLEGRGCTGFVNEICVLYLGQSLGLLFEKPKIVVFDPHVRITEAHFKNLLLVGSLPNQWNRNL